MKKVDNKSKQRTLAGIAIIVVVILIASAVFVYSEYYNEEEEPVEEEIIEVIDDQISPLENQAMVIEILRMRHRGLYDKLMTWGNSWKTKPRFYFVVNLDDLEYSSKEVAGLTSSSQVLFKGWDTMFQENKIVRDAEEEQEKSSITVKIIEVVEVKQGLFRKTNKEYEREKFSVTYDYRTGRWYGDDNFRDYDGYGHYKGSTFEIWFNIYQMDYDLDYIPYWTEVNVLGTDPMRDDSNKDPDEDGVPTAWEWKWGYDPFTWDDHEKLDPDIDGVENVEEYQMERWLSDPYHQDFYIEVDHTGRGGFFDPPHVLWEECEQAIIEKYAEHNINVYFDNGWPDSPKNGGGEELPHYSAISQDSGIILQYYNHHFPDERKGIFRYVLVGHGGPFNHPAKSNVYDCIHVGYSVEPKKLIKQFFVGNWYILPTARGQRIKVASTLMHELGHSVGITPWSFEGCDNLSYAQGGQAAKDFKKKWGDNYWSVMNYYNMYSNDLLDYSDGSNGPPYDQNDWENLFCASFQYNVELVEEIFFEPPGLDKIVWGETETGVTGYKYDEKLTEEITKRMGDWSPVKPIKVNWLVFKLKDKERFPDFKDLKILVQPDVPYAGWAGYAEGNLDSDGEMQFYSQQAIIDELMEQI
jgi:hypothetical protein